MNIRARQRVLVLRVLVLSLVLTLLGRLWYVQVLSGSTYQQAASSNAVRDIISAAPRGEIVDDEGRALASNEYEYTITVDPTALAKLPTVPVDGPDSEAAVLARLAPIVGESLKDLTSATLLCEPALVKKKIPCYNGSPLEPIPVKSFAPTDTAGLARALVIEERAELFPGVTFAEAPVRVYPYGALAGQELGYLGRITSTQLTEAAYKDYADQTNALVGESGLEQEYDQQLRGTPADQKVSVNYAGQVTGTVGTTQPVVGQTLVTNIDAGLQEAVEKELVNAIKIGQQPGQGDGLATTASAVVLNPQNGAVLAMASLPDYDPNDFNGGEGISTKAYAALTAPTASNPLISRAFSAAFSPGSTFKASSSAAILQHGLSTGSGAPPATASTRTACPSSYQVGTFNFKNFEGEAKPPLTITQALQYSCDTFFYQYAYAQWVDDGGLRADAAHQRFPDNQYFARMAKSFGYGAYTGIDLPNESKGIIYDRAEIAAAAKIEKVQYCKGATSHPNDPAREKTDRTYCQDPTLGLEQAGDAVDFAIGQGGQVLVTPLQQAAAYAAVANGGTLYQPQIAKAFLSPTGQLLKKVAPVVNGHLPVSAQNLATIRAGLTLVVQAPGGTANGAGFDPQLDVAGKTGTADVSDDPTSPLLHQPESWFVSMQPVSHPKYVVVVMVEHGGQGAYAAAETTANIYKDIYGLDGHQAVWPGGQQPAALPVFSPTTNTFTAPQRHLIGVSRQPARPGGTPDPVAVQAAEEALAAQAAAARKSAASRAAGA